jgi:AcrR family transcriptional regulator
MNQGSIAPLGRVNRRRSSAKARVIDAASGLFAERGFEETPMALVAEQADVSVGTLYNLFANKDALFRELIHGKAVLVRERLSRALGSSAGSALAAVDAFLAEIQSVYRTEAPYIRIYFHVHDHAHLSFRTSLSEDTRHVYDETRTQLTGVLERGQSVGEFPLSAPAAHAAVAITAVAGELFFLSVAAPSQHDESALLDEVRRIVHTGVLGLSYSVAERRNPNETQEHSR